MAAIITTDNLKNLFRRASPYGKPPTRSTSIQDTFVNISSVGNTIDSNVSTYVVQDLAPNQTYKLKFQILKEDPDTNSYVNVIGTNVFLNPASMAYVDPTKTTGTAGEFFWSNQTPNRELYFKTANHDTTANINSVNFGSVRIGENFNTPPSVAGYTSFNGVKSLNLLTNGKPSGGFASPAASAIIPNSYDGYLFIFESKPYSVTPHEHYTSRFETNDFVGYNPSNNQVGFYRLANIHTSAGGSNVNSGFFSETMFTSIDGVFYAYNAGNGLVREKIYIAALMLVNTASQYVVTIDRDGGVASDIRWFTAEIPVGGVWSISLGPILNVQTAVNANLSPATAVAVSVDSISVAGTVTDLDNFKLIITAEPV